MPPPPDSPQAGRIELIADSKGERLDKYLSSRYTDLTRSRIQKLIAEGQVRLNGRPTRASFPVSPGDRVSILWPSTSPLLPAPESIPLKVVYEDEHVSVIDKPPGIPTHPGPGHQARTVASALLARYPALAQVGDPARPGLVHRLDKDTSGLLMVAKTGLAYDSLVSQLKSRSVTKRYLALVKGEVPYPEGLIEAPLGRSPRHRKKIAVVARGKEAVTRFKVLQILKSYTLLEVAPETGRTHQIRVHLAAAGYPVAGDLTYGVRLSGLNRQFLHASYIKFRLPDSSREIELTSDLPPDLRVVLDKLVSC